MKSEIKKIFLYYRWFIKYTKEYIPSIIFVLALDIANSLSSVALAIISKHMVDNAISGNLKYVFYFIAIFAGIIAVNMLSNAIASIKAVKVQEAFTNGLRQRLFERICGTEWYEVTRYHSGDILTRLTSDVGTVSNGVVNTFPSIISLLFQMIAAFVTLLTYEPYLAVLAFVLGPITIILSRLWGRKLKSLHIKIQESESLYRSFIQESLEKFTILKAFCMERNKVDTLGNYQNDRMNLILSRNKMNVAASTILSAGYWVGYFLAFGWGAIRLAQKATTFGTLTAFLQLVGQVQQPFVNLAQSLPQVISTVASAGRLMELEELEMEKEGEQVNNKSLVEVIMDGVDFSYNKEDVVLRKASFHMKPCEIFALIGPSGEGKTTIIRLLLALLKPGSGRIVYKDENGIEFQASASTRHLIAYVPQGNTLFSGTIADNLRAGNPEATEEELKDAAIKACAWEFIEKLPEGLDTMLGENGLGLSEGQAQRISIARAILRKVPVLILDEATSALDMELEMRVLEGLKNLQPARTCLVITHRMSALKICSKIVKLKDGILMEQKPESNNDEGLDDVKNL
jgi:ABC-type multidrug transport system, ATPase and permease components